MFGNFRNTKNGKKIKEWKNIDEMQGSACLCQIWLNQGGGGACAMEKNCQAMHVRQ